jgi:hypothetical protein
VIEDGDAERAEELREVIQDFVAAGLVDVRIAADGRRWYKLSDRARAMTRVELDAAMVVARGLGRAS